jgi:hypothetical protein
LKQDAIRTDVIWIGGGTGSGKTTVARMLSRRHRLRQFAIDSFWYAHSERLGEREPSPTEQWLWRSPAEQAAEFERSAKGRMGLVLEQLGTLPAAPGIVVEGPQVLPDALPRDAAAVFLTATPDFQRAQLIGRPITGTPDPRRALANRIEKDRLFAARVAGRAAALGFATIRIDGTRPPEAIVAEIEQLLGAPPPGEVELAAVRHWENDAYARNARAWLESLHAPSEEPVLPFACECGEPACAEFVELKLAKYEAAGRALADGHGDCF